MEGWQYSQKLGSEKLWMKMIKKTVEIMRIQLKYYLVQRSKGKTMKKWTYYKRLWDAIKKISIHILSVPEGEER